MSVLYIRDKDGKLHPVPYISQPNKVEHEPADNDIPKVFFGEALPQTKDDTVMSFRYVSKNKEIVGYCKTKAQGNSSMQFPKKNQTVKLYKDADCTEKLKVNFKGWGEQNKFCFKANWIDLTHARNIVSARLWGDVVKSRTNYDSIPELLRTSPNHGAVDGFPVKVYAGGVYQGRYTLNIPKDAWMANMNDGLDNHCILCGENYVSGCFRAEAKIDESDWTDEVHDTVPTVIKQRWNEAIRFVMNSTDAEFVAGIGNYFDLDSLIDYYLFGLVTCNNDGFGKNQLYMTYDGQKWYATVYDVDNTFGTFLGYVSSYTKPRNDYQDFRDGDGNLLYIRLESLFRDAIKARYAQLKTGALSKENILSAVECFMEICPPYLVAEDYAETTAGGAFTGIPLQAESNIQQIRDFVVTRYPYVEEYVTYLGEDPTLLYRLPGETTFDGVDDHVDTGVSLFADSGTFTIVCDLTSATDAAGNSMPFSCREDKPNSDGSHVGGISVRRASSNNFVVTSAPGSNGDTWRCPNIFSAENRLAMAIVFTNGVLTAMKRKTYGSSEIVTEQINNHPAVAKHTRKLYLGGPERYTSSQGYLLDLQIWKGTIHSFEVYNYAMTAEEIAEKLM